jgi:hypothetical protein
VTWEFAPVLDAAHRAALSAGKPLVYVCPPAGWAARALFAALPHPAPSRPTLVIVADLATASDLVTALRPLTDLGPLHPATGLARTEQLLRAGQVGTLLATLPDTLALVRRSALKPETVGRLVLAWPEQLLALGLGDALDTLLADAGVAHRLVLTADETAIADLLERHARRAPVAWAARLPPAPVRHARYAIVELARRPHAVRAVLDVLGPARALLWDPTPDAAARWAGLTSSPEVALFAGNDAQAVGPAAVAIAADLPSAEVLGALGAAAAEIVVLLGAGQLAYLQRIAAPLDALRLPGASDHARDWVSALRQEVRERLDAGTPLAELLALEPLFDEYDPALVAAALLAARARPASPAADDVPAWVRVHVSAGRRERLRPGDLVGALLNAVGLAKEDVGRIEIREGFALVDVRAGEAERAARGLNGTTIRGTRIVARLDRR